MSWYSLLSLIWAQPVRRMACLIVLCCRAVLCGQISSLEHLGRLVGGGGLQRKWIRLVVVWLLKLALVGLPVLNCLTRTGHWWGAQVWYGQVRSQGVMAVKLSMVLV